jgi:sigma-E factor negative regulatory protein RseC
MAEVAEKAVELPTDPYASYGVGDEVEVVLKASMGMKAVWLAYCIPLLVLLAVILGLFALGTGEVVAGVAGLAAVGVYYLLLWLFRDRLRNEYVFTIKG